MEELGLSVFDLLAPVIAMLLGWLSSKLSRLISVKVSNEYLRGVMIRLNDAVFVVVKELNQTVVDELKRARGEQSDGGYKLTPDEKRTIKARALSQLKSYLGAKGLAELGKVLGLSEDAVDAFLGARIEAAVADASLGKI